MVVSITSPNCFIPDISIQDNSRVINISNSNVDRKTPNIMAKMANAHRTGKGSGAVLFLSIVVMFAKQAGGLVVFAADKAEKVLDFEGFAYFKGLPVLNPDHAPE
jgi:hypothetical protein